MIIPEGKKVYFASDHHFGAPDRARSLVREKHFVKWLTEVSRDAHAIFLVGDIFDFWFEYKSAVPKGFVRLLGKLAELSDAGIEIHFFQGNHDMWTFDYLPSEIGLTLHPHPIQVSMNDKKFFIGHGDGLGPGDKGYKFIKKVFRNPFCQWAFARLHPNFGIGLADYFSKRSRAQNAEYDKEFLGDENEWLAIYSKEQLAKEHFDYFVFGHRHLPLDIQLSENSRYINLGDWVVDFTFATFDGQELELKHYEKPGQ